MKTIALTAFAALLICAGPAAAQTQKIAFVDSVRAASNSRDGKAAQEKLQALSDKKRDEFKPKEERFKKLQEEFETQRFVLSQEALQERELELLKTKRNLERDLEEAQEEFEIEQRRLMQPILKQIYDVVGKVAKDQGYDMVLERTTPFVLFYADSLDITEKVIERLNEG